MKYDYRRLRGLIKTRFNSESEFAKVLGMNRSTLSLNCRMNETSQERIFKKFLRNSLFRSTR